MTGVTQSPIHFVELDFSGDNPVTDSGTIDAGDSALGHLDLATGLLEQLRTPTPVPALTDASATSPTRSSEMLDLALANISHSPGEAPTFAFVSSAELRRNLVSSVAAKLAEGPENSILLLVDSASNQESYYELLVAEDGLNVAADKIASLAADEYRASPSMYCPRLESASIVIIPCGVATLSVFARLREREYSFSHVLADSPSASLRLASSLTSTFAHSIGQFWSSTSSNLWTPDLERAPFLEIGHGHDLSAKRVYPVNCHTIATSKPHEVASRNAIPQSDYDAGLSKILNTAPDKIGCAVQVFSTETDTVSSQPFRERRTLFVVEDAKTAKYVVDRLNASFDSDTFAMRVPGIYKLPEGRAEQLQQQIDSNDTRVVIGKRIDFPKWDLSAFESIFNLEETTDPFKPRRLLDLVCRYDDQRPNKTVTAVSFVTRGMDQSVTFADVLAG